MEQVLKRGCCNCGKLTLKLIVRVFGITYVSLVAALALAARYQYSTDLMVTVFVTLLVTTHPWTTRFAKVIFIKRVREDGDESEGVALVRPDLSMDSNTV